MLIGKRWGALAVSVGMGLLPGAVRAEEVEADVMPSPPRTVFLVHPVNQLGVSVEHALGSHVTLAASLLGGVYLFGTHRESAPGVSGTWSVGFNPGVHVYLAGRAPEGFWVGAHLESEWSQSRVRSAILGPLGAQEVILKEKTYALGGSARAGYTAILASGLTLQAAVGLGVLDRRQVSDEDSTGGVISGLGTLGALSTGWAVAPRLSFGLGWAF